VMQGRRGQVRNGQMVAKGRRGGVWTGLWWTTRRCKSGLCVIRQFL